MRMRVWLAAAVGAPVVAVVGFACGGSSSSISGLGTWENYSTGPTLTAKNASVDCPSGKKALGGGYKIDPLKNMLAKGIDIRVWWTAPNNVNLPSPSTGWSAEAFENPPDPSTDPDDHDWGIRVWVICADT